MNWISLTEPTQIDTLVERSRTKPQVIFKHSTRCAISSTAKHRLETARPNDAADFYYLDLISFRNISNQISEQFRIPHASPQVLVIKDGQCIFDESHLSISMDEIMKEAVA